MLKKLTLTSLVAMTVGASVFAMTEPSAAQAMRSNSSVYSRSNDDYSWVRYQRYPKRDMDYYDNEANSMDWPYGRGVGH